VFIFQKEKDKSRIKKRSHLVNPFSWCAMLYERETGFDLVMAKLVASLLLTAASVVGLVAPFWFFRLIWPLMPASPASARHDRDDDAPTDELSAAVRVSPSSTTAAVVSDHHPHRAAAPHNANSVVSVANCVSAGILLWTGMMHFFLESASSFSSPHLCPLASASSTPEVIGLVCLELGVGRAVQCFMCGILIPLLVEKVIWPYVTTNLSRSQEAGSGDPSVAALLATHGHSHGNAVHSNNSSTSSSSQLGSATQQQQQQQLRRKQKDVASAVLIAILMSVHSATEGIAIGVEPSTASMRGSVAPLLVHKVFDGWLVGVSVYRACDIALRNSGLVDVCRHIFLRAPQRYALWIWLAALPLLLMSVAMVVPPGVVHEQDGAGGHHHLGSTMSVAVAQATSSGSFLYVAVCAILLEELNDSSQSVVSGLPQIKKQALLVGSCIAGLFLGRFLSGGHE
jgi:zinc transporter ZupT